MSRWRQNDVRQNGGYEILGHLWSRDGKRWSRKLLRKLRKSGTHQWCDLTYVDGDDPEFCMRCLSQDVELVLNDQHDSLDQCNSCGLRWRITDTYE